MTVLTRLKLALALIGVAIFGAGIKLDNGRLRLVGIVFVAAAWLLRFARPRHEAVDDSTPPEK